MSNYTTSSPHYSGQVYDLTDAPSSPDYNPDTRPDSPRYGDASPPINYRNFDEPISRPESPAMDIEDEIPRWVPFYEGPLPPLVVERPTVILSERESEEIRKGILRTSAAGEFHLCPICLESITAYGDNRHYGCKHHLHKECNEDYLRSGNHACPLCRYEIAEVYQCSPADPAEKKRVLETGIKLMKKKLSDHKKTMASIKKRAEKLEAKIAEMEKTRELISQDCRGANNQQQ